MATTAHEPNASLKEKSCSDPPPASDDVLGAEDNCTEETVGAFLSEAESLKDRGNIEFQKGRVLAKHTAGKNLISDACLLYAEGLRALASVDEGLAKLVHELEEEEQEKQVAVESDPPSPLTRKDLETIPATLSALSRRADLIRPSLYLNLAACNLLLREEAAAIACCTHVLERCGDGIAAAVAFADEGGSGILSDSLVPVEGLREGEGDDDTRRCRELATKALYRRSTARQGGGDWVTAREDLVRALRLKPGDASIRRELKKVDKKVTDARASEALRRETEDGRTRRQQRQQKQQQHQQEQQQQEQQHEHGEQLYASTSSLREDTPMDEKPGATIDAAAASGGDAKKSDAGPKSSAPPADHAVPGTNSDSPGLIEDKEQDERHRPSDQGAQPRGGQPGDDEEPFPIANGGECREGLYSWNQSIREVQVCVKVPDWAGASDLSVDIRRSRLSIAVLPRNSPDHPCSDGTSPTPTPTPAIKGKDESGVVAPAAAASLDEKKSSVLAGGLARPVQVDECLWTTERRGSVVLYLQKELPAEGEPGFEWWTSVMEGDPEIDTLTCDAGSVASEYPEHARRRGAKAVWDDQRKSPEEKLKEQRMRDARRQMVEEGEERQRNLEDALKDPNKAELYRQLKETMPDVPISMK